MFLAVEQERVMATFDPPFLLVCPDKKAPDDAGAFSRGNNPESVPGDNRAAEFIGQTQQTNIRRYVNVSAETYVWSRWKHVRHVAEIGVTVFTANCPVVGQHGLNAAASGPPGFGC
jgi:hypothetical protein